MIIANFIQFVYVACVVLLTAYALGAGIMLMVYLVNRRTPPPPPAIMPTTFPHVVIQLPVYNEPRVVERLIAAAASQDYPMDRFEVQVLDDSTDETSARIAEQVALWTARGVCITHVQRSSRMGFKAGALAHGLTLTQADFAAVFDADFVPPPDFLRRTIAHLCQHPNMGMVQTRWGHLNADENLLTRAVAVALDGHFVVEQQARSAAGWLLNFNGSGGVWRIQAIRDAGGWRSDTLTEDLDLSYRAQLTGWRLGYMPDLVVPGEIPPRLSIYRQQQARWAQGGTQCFRRLIVPLWRHPKLTLMQRVMGTMHLAQYLVHALILALIVITPFLILSGNLPLINVGPLSLVGLFPPLMYAFSQQAIYPDWRRRMGRGFPTLALVATGMALGNARSALMGLVLHGGEFARTPKFGATGAAAGVRTPIVTWELILCLYTAWGVWLAMRHAPALIAYFLIYCFAFGIMTICLLRDSLQAQRVVKSRL